LKYFKVEKGQTRVLIYC